MPPESPADNRFYPASLPPFPHEALPHAFCKRAAGEVRGCGLITVQSWDPGSIVFAFAGHRSSTVTLFSLTVEHDVHVHDPYVMGWVLHSCDPNMDCDMGTFTFRARRPIAAGEWCTMDYMQTEQRLFRGFPCRCGSANCRGWIGSR